MKELNELCQNCLNDCIQFAGTEVMKCKRYPQGAPRQTLTKSVKSLRIAPDRSGAKNYVNLGKTTPNNKKGLRND